MNKYKRNSEAEIKQLKIDLMNSNSFPPLSHNSTTNVTGSLNNIKNEYIEKIFKENVREILRENFGSKDNDIDKNLKYREIKFGEEVKIVSLNFPQSMKIDSIDYLFIMKEDGSLIISRGNIMNNVPIFVDKRINMSLFLGKNELSISKTKNIEMNGAFKIKNFNISSFNRNEIAVINNNVKLNEKPFDYIVIESAFNKANIQDMINRIKSDKLFLEKMISKRIFYCGILNLKDGDNSFMFFDCDCECMIIGIINSTFFGKDVSKYYDWENRKDIKSIKTELRELEPRVTSIESRVTSIESRVSSIEKILKQLVNEVSILNAKFNQVIEKKQKEKEPNDKYN